jgi:GNAT superfamily N-acetyltransferase
LDLNEGELMKKILFHEKTRGISICRVSIDVIFDLRYRILRAGLPKESAQFPGDNDASTWHVAVFRSPEEDALPVTCGTFMLNAYREQRAWQLRGMATDHGHQGRGYGGELLRYAQPLIAFDSSVRLFWCNARVPAIPFYERHGWKVDSEEFDIPTAGPHRKMVKQV